MGTPTSFKQLDHALLHRVVLLLREVCLDRLPELAADRQNGVERRHRVLEDHRDLVAAEVALLPLAELQQVAALEQRLAA